MYIKGLLQALAPHVTADHLIISIAAGVRIASIEELLPVASKVVRVPGIGLLASKAGCLQLLYWRSRCD